MQREPLNHIIIAAGGSPTEQQPAVRRGSKSADGGFDFRRVVNPHSDDRYPKLGRCRIHGSWNPTTRIGVVRNWRNDMCDPGQARYGLLEQLQPLATERSEIVRKSGHIAAGSCYVADQTSRAVAT